MYLKTQERADGAEYEGKEALKGPKQGYAKQCANLTILFSTQDYFIVLFALSMLKLDQYANASCCHARSAQPTKSFNTDSSGQRQDFVAQHRVISFLTLSSGASLAFIKTKIKQAEYPMSGLSESSPIPIKNKQTKKTVMYFPQEHELANASMFYRWVSCITDHYIISMLRVNLDKK